MKNILDISKEYNIEDLRQKKIAIFGAGIVGRLTLHCLRKNNLDAELIIDTNENLKNKDFFGCKIYSHNDFIKKFNSDDFNIILCHKFIDAALSIINKFKYKNVIFSNYLWKDTKFEENENKIFDIEINSIQRQRMIELLEFSILKASSKFNNKTFIKHIDITITERCSMKCRDCANLMQFYKKPQNANFEEMLVAMKNLSESVDEIYEYRVLGGDPFMNKEMYKSVNAIKEFDNVHNIIVYTNAKIIPKNENLNCLKHPKVRVQITNYGKNLSSAHDEIVALFKKEKIAYVSERVKQWDDVGRVEYIDEPDEVTSKKFEDCCANDLFTILNGKLFKCPVSAHATNLKAVPYDESFDGVNLINFKDKKNLKDQINNFYNNNKYVSACKYCKGRGFGEGTIEAAIQTKEPLPLWNE